MVHSIGVHIMVIELWDGNERRTFEIPKGFWDKLDVLVKKLPKEYNSKVSTMCGDFVLILYRKYGYSGRDYMYISVKHKDCEGQDGWEFYE